MNDEVTVDDLLNLFKKSINKKSDGEAREQHLYAVIHRAANGLPTTIFASEMWNATSLYGAYIEIFRYIGKDKDKFKAKMKEFNETIIKVNNNLSEILENWDGVIDKIKEEKEKNASG